MIPKKSGQRPPHHQHLGPQEVGAHVHSSRAFNYLRAPVSAVKQIACFLHGTRPKGWGWGRNDLFFSSCVCWINPTSWIHCKHSHFVLRRICNPKPASCAPRVDSWELLRSKIFVTTAPLVCSASHPVSTHKSESWRHRERIDKKMLVAPRLYCTFFSTLLQSRGLN